MEDCKNGSKCGRVSSFERATTPDAPPAVERMTQEKFARTRAEISVNSARCRAVIAQESAKIAEMELQLNIAAFDLQQYPG